MPSTPFTNVAKEVWADLITLPRTPNGTLDPTVIHMDDTGEVHLQKKDLSAYRKLFCAAGTSAETNAVVIQSSLNTTNSAVTGNTGNITTNSTDIGDNATDIATNQGNISTNAGGVTTNAGDITALTAQNEATVWWYEESGIDFVTAGSTTIPVSLPGDVRVTDVKFIFAGSDLQRTPVTSPTLTVQFTNGTAGTILEWTSAAGIKIPESLILSIPQWTLNDGGVGANIEVTTSQTTFGATPSFTILVGVIRDPIT
jgi:hypothetical protein